MTVSIIIHLWSFQPKYPYVCGIVIPIINLMFCSVSIYLTTLLIYMSPVFEVIHITGALFFSLHSVFMLIYCNTENSLFDIILIDILAFLVLVIFVSRFLFRILSYRVVSKLNIPHLNHISDFSDDSDYDYQLPKLKPRDMVTLLRQLAITGNPDLSEFAMKIVENERNSDIVLECYRILSLFGCISSAMWSHILELQRKDIPFYNHSLLCDLQYEAIKNEQPHELIDPLVRNMNDMMIDVQQCLLTFNDFLFKQNMTKAQEALMLCSIASRRYEVISNVYLCNSPKSHHIADHYADFMNQLRGDYRASNYWKQRADALKNGHYSFMASQTTGMHMFQSMTNIDNSSEETKPSKGVIMQQQLISQQVVDNIHSRRIPAALIMMSVLVLLILLSIFIDPTAYTPYKINKKTYYKPCLSICSLFFGQLYDSVFAVNRLMKRSFTIVPTCCNITLNTISIIFSDLLKSVPYQKNIKEMWISLPFSESVPLPVSAIASSLNDSITEAMKISDEHSKEIADVLFNHIEVFTNAILEIDACLEEYSEYLVSRCDRFISASTVMCIIFYLIFALVVFFTMTILLRNEREKIIRVFFKIDLDSLTQFKDNLKSLVKTPVTHPFQGDEYSLALDEIEIDDNDPISLPINVSMNNEQESSENTDAYDIIKVNKLDPITISAYWTYGFLLIIAIVTFLFLENRVIILHNRDLANDRELLHDCLMFCVKLFHQGKIISFHNKIDDFVFIEELNISEARIQFFPYIGNVHENYHKAKAIKNIRIFLDVALNQSTIAMNYLINNYTNLMTHYNEESFNRIQYLIDFVLLVLLSVLMFLSARYLQNASGMFDSLKAILNLMPSKYFSTIATVLSIYKRKSDEKADVAPKYHSKLITKHVSLPLIAIDSNTRISFQNQSAMRVFQIKSDVTVQKPLVKVFERTKYLDFYRTLDDLKNEYENATAECDLKYERNNETDLHLKCHFIPFFLGHRFFILIIFLDIEQIMQNKLKIAEKKKENLELLSKLIPKPISMKYLQTSKSILMKVESASLIYIEILNFSEFCETHNHNQISDLLDFLCKRYNKIFRKIPEISKIKQRNGVCLAVSGIFASKPNNHSKIALDFVNKCARFLKKKKGVLLTDLTLRAGVFSVKDIKCGIFNREIPEFDLTCEFLPKIYRIMPKCPPMKVIVTKETLDVLDDASSFKMFERFENTQLYLDDL